MIAQATSDLYAYKYPLAPAIARQRRELMNAWAHHCGGLDAPMSSSEELEVFKMLRDADRRWEQTPAFVEVFRTRSARAQAQ